MKIIRAMKKISRIKGEIKELKKRMAICLNTMSENEFPEDFKTIEQLFENKVVELIRLKAAVMTANVNANKFKVILNLGELKSKMDFLNELMPKSGVQETRWNESKTTYKSQLTLAQKNKMLEDCQANINSLTDELDDFNAKTDIEE